MGRRSQSIQLEFLKQVQEPLRTEVADRLREIKVKKNRVLVEKDSTLKDVFFLREGKAEVLLYSENGREVCVNDVGPDDMLGEMSAVDGKPRSASVVAKTDLRVEAMSKEDFMACLESSPAAGIWLARRLASHVRRLTEQVFELSALNVQTRIRCEFLRLADKGEPCSGGLEVRPNPTNEAISQHIGTGKEAVSRERRVLKDEGIIRYTRQVLTIIDRKRLARSIRR